MRTIEFELRKCKYLGDCELPGRADCVGKLWMDTREVAHEDLYEYCKRVNEYLSQQGLKDYPKINSVSCPEYSDTGVLYIGGTSIPCGEVVCNKVMTSENWRKCKVVITLLQQLVEDDVLDINEVYLVERPTEASISFLLWR